MHRFQFSRILVLTCLITLIGVSVSPDIWINSPSQMGLTVEVKSDVESVQQETNLGFIDVGGILYESILLDAAKVESLKQEVGVFSGDNDYNCRVGEFGTGLSPRTEEQWDQLVGNVATGKMVGQLVGGELKLADAIPSAYNFSSQKYFPVVGNQGTQGSCSAWAVSYYAFGYLEAKDYGWDAASGDPRYLLSPAWTYNKVSGNGEGSYMDDNAEILRDWGCATMSAMPYDQNDYDSWGNSTAWEEAPPHQVKDYHDIAASGDDLIATIKSLVANDVPVVFAITSSGNFYGAGFTGDWIMSLADYIPDDIDHAQCIVGYNDTIVDGTDTGAFRVVNSWGAGWGDSGYYWLTYDALKEIGFAAGPAYLEDEVNYNPRLVASWEFDPGPVRNNTMIKVGIGSPADPIDYLRPYYIGNKIYPTYLFPGNMCVDISRFFNHWELGNCTFFLEVGDATPTDGTIISFRVDYYENYQPGSSLRTSPASSDVPENTPGVVTVVLASPPPQVTDFGGRVVYDTINLQWTPPVVTTDPGYNGFHLYKMVDGPTPILMASLGNTTGTYSDPTISQGHAYTYIIRAYDDLGEGFGASCALSVTPPVITILTPLPFEIYRLTPPNFTLMIEESNLDQLWYTLDGGKTNTSFTGTNGIIDPVLWQNLTLGNFTLAFYASDHDGNIGWTMVPLTKAIGIPQETRELVTMVTLLVITAAIVSLALVKWHR